MENTQIEVDLAALASLKAEKARIEDAIKEITKRLVAEAESRETKTVETEKRKYTVVSTERVSYDDDKMRHILTSKQWKSISTRKTDQKKLATALATGIVDPADISDGVTISKSSPYLRVSSKESSS